MSNLSEILANLVDGSNAEVLAELAGVGALAKISRDQQVNLRTPTTTAAIQKAGQILAAQQALKAAEAVTREKRGAAYGRPTLPVGIDSDATLGAGVPILAGATQTLRTTTIDKGRPVSFRVHAGNAADFLINNIQVKRTSCFSSNQGVPADAYVLEPLPLDCEMCEPNTPIAVTVTNLAGAPRRFLAEFRMEDAD